MFDSVQLWKQGIESAEACVVCVVVVGSVEVDASELSGRQHLNQESERPPLAVPAIVYELQIHAEVVSTSGGWQRVEACQHVRIP